MRKSTLVTLFSALLCGVAYFTLTSCKKTTPTLPPAATSIKWAFGEQAYKHTEAICKLGPRPIESEAHKQTQAYIFEQLTKLGWTAKNQEFTTETPYGPRTFNNIIARKINSSETSETLKSPEILLTAHYDSKMLEGFLGADDAASCVGALLEIAEFLPQVDPATAERVELVFFDGEEALKKNIEPNKDGLYGSQYYSMNLNNDVTSTKTNYSKRPKFGILLDMIGHKNLAVKIPSDTPYGLRKSYYSIVEKLKFEKHFDVARSPIIDDHLFMNEVALVPTIDLIGDFAPPKNNWWHTSKDDFSNISQDSLAKSIQLTIELMLHYDATH